MPLPWLIFTLYIAAVSVISVIICVYDKVISKRNNVKLRIPEKTLLLWSALGGSVAMYLCMQLIRHKTKHVKFMVGIPVIMVVQAVLIGLLIYFKVLPV